MKQRDNFSVRDIQPAIATILLAMVLILVYLPAIRGGFLWDDHLLITDNPLVTGSHGLAAIWTGSHSMDFTPLTTTLFWIEWRIWGGNPAGFHVVNILLHAFSALLLWRVLEKLAIPGAWIGALLFAFHPVTVASVAWISELKNVLALLFYLMSISWFLDYEQSAKPERSYGLSLIAAVCAFLSKGSTVILPAVLLGCVLWRKKKIIRHDCLALAPYFLLAAVMACVTIHYQAQIISPITARAPIPFRVVRASEAVWLYLYKDLLPVHIMTIYPMWRIGMDSPLTYLPALLIILCIAFLFNMRKRGGLFAFGYFILALLPVLGVLDMGFLDQAYTADWWQELALPAVAAAAGAGAAMLWQRSPSQLRPVWIGLGCVLAAILMLQIHGLAGNYRSEEFFWRQALSENPNAWGAEDNLGNLLQDQRNYDAAVACYTVSLKINPISKMTYFDLGNALQKRGEPGQAIAAYKEALRLAPDDAPLHNSLGAALNAAGDRTGAMDEYQEALRLDPGYAPAHNNIGLVLQSEGKSDPAIMEFQTALDLDADNADTHFNLACALQAQGKLDPAIREYGRALQLKPDYAEACNDLGNALQAEGRSGEAAVQYRETLRLDPNAALASLNLGTLLLKQGNQSEGLDYLRKGANLQPNSPQAQWAVGSALFRAGYSDEGMTYLEKAIHCYADDPEAYLEVAGLLDQCKAYKQEAAIYHEAIARHPDSTALTKAYATFSAASPDDPSRAVPK